MKLKVLASGSTGNCYLLESEKEILIIELGISFKDILMELNVPKVVGALVTHEHKDHSKAVQEATNRGIKVYMTHGTASKCFEEIPPAVRKVKYRTEYQVGEFKIVPFETEHDVEEPCGFMITHKEMGTMIFATDTYYIRYNFNGVHHWLIECNYKKDILENNVEIGIISKPRARRVEESHFELGNVKEFFKTKNLSHTKNVVLLHLSGDNSDANEFKEEIYNVVNKPTYIARKGLEIDLTLCPF